MATMVRGTLHRSWAGGVTAGLLHGVVSLALLFAWTAAAHGNGGDATLVHACVHKTNGKTRFVSPTETCRSTETPVHWARGGSVETPGVPGPAGPPGPQGPPGPAGSAFLEVVDAAGAVVGPVVSLEYLNAVVGFRMDGLPFVLRLFEGAFWGHEWAFFQSGDCTGPVYLRRNGTALPVAAVDPEGRVHVDDGRNTPASLVLNSFADPTGCYPATFTFSVVPGTFALDLTQFTAPFRVR